MQANKADLTLLSIYLIENCFIYFVYNYAAHRTTVADVKNLAFSD